MDRYYMNADTREALIAESKRLIAARAERQATRAASTADIEPGNDACFAAVGEGSAVSDSAFSRLVSDLSATGSLPPAAWERRRRSGDRRAAA
ncbi:MAG: hypothetical protein ABIO71_06715 [Caldimonas sp.]